ncbi:MAG TPA: thiamine pyrophosphate-dependent enzyme [Candidatus Binatia bacterium]|jgi:thiamine pyrophosphate-dependent acetolactate synthase large subunit-like protein|nr:thiamine pyrophosphate-dependent enzyme [Candidatus Binatia bacterium]HEU4639834.1 thiamine pyrophosphate-dependent enzyme [Candidatus Binatia bacterium]HYQ97478.1 thiamine pyrophosphate-dependent enzyme [Candidatus Nitrosocosmicus sp.]
MSSESSKPQRQEILKELKSSLKETDLVVAALAGTTADSYQIIDRPGNLYLVGMGMVSQVAFGLATALPNCRVFALDTDGSMLLAPSILPVIGSYKPKNLYMIVFDNEQLFGSRGGPKSQTATGTDIAAIAKASAIENVRTLRNQDSLGAEVARFLSVQGPSVMVAKIQALGRGAGPKMDGQENKYKLIRHIEKIANIEILGAPKP